MSDIDVWTRDGHFTPEWVSKHDSHVVLGFDDHKLSFPWHAIQEIQEEYDDMVVAEEDTEVWG